MFWKIRARATTTEKVSGVVDLPQPYIWSHKHNVPLLHIHTVSFPVHKAIHKSIRDKAPPLDVIAYPFRSPQHMHYWRSVEHAKHVSGPHPRTGKSSSVLLGKHHLPVAQSM
jgi:hypothetical protein